MTILQPVLQPVLRPLLADPLAPGFGNPLTVAINALTDAIAAWASSQSAERVSYGGNEGTWAQSANLAGPGSGGRTFVAGTTVQGIRQHGYIRSVKYECRTTGNASGYKFKLLRPNGTGFDVVAETPKFTATAGVNTYVPAQPLGPCQPGDRIGLWMDNGTIWVTSNASGTTYYANGDLSSVTIATATATSYDMNIQCFGTPPFIVGTGDSIMEGHNSASPWHSFLHIGPSGNPAAEILHGMRDLVSTLEYQNFGVSGARWDNTTTRGAAIAAIKPRAVIVHCGINDIIALRSWASIEPEMDAFLAALPVGTALFINQVMPRSDGSDTNATAIRALNANYETWCATNGAYLIRTHDPMGQVRASTGAIDDLVTAYNYDNTHLTVPDGVNALARVMTLAAGAVAL